MGDVWDVVVIGTGFGGSLAALPAVEAGLRVLLLERGRWVDRDDSAWDAKQILVDRKYRSASPYYQQTRLGRSTIYPDEVVGGKSVFYGAASMRFREQDFDLTSQFGTGADAPPSWPIRYPDLAPYYDDVEQLLGVAGVAGVDPNEPPRGCGYAHEPPAYSEPARRVAQAATTLGLRPFPLPLAINYGNDGGRQSCVQCMTCDLFPCKISAKNDLAVTVIPQAQRSGAEVLHSTIVARLIRRQDAITEIECLDIQSGKRFVVRCQVCIVSAGAIGSAALLLSSGLGNQGPSGALVGRYLMRHCSGIVIGLFPFETNVARRFHKQVGITDFYHGRDEEGPRGPWGMIQGLQTPPPEFMVAEGGFPIGVLGARTVRRHIYLICIGQDLPQAANRVKIDPGQQDVYGLPVPLIHHRYSKHDLAVRRALYRQAARILRAAGAVIRLRKPINTFSHVVGTCRFGANPETAVLDPWCRFHGMRNLFVVDGSFMPTSAGVNPSLTIAANGLRVGRHIVANWDRYAAGVGVAVE